MASTAGKLQTYSTPQKQSTSSHSPITALISPLPCTVLFTSFHCTSSLRDWCRPTRQTIYIHTIHLILSTNNLQVTHILLVLLHDQLWVAHFLSVDSDIWDRTGKNAERVNYTSILAYVIHKSVTHTVLFLYPCHQHLPTSNQAHQVRMDIFTTSTNHIRTTLSLLWMIVITFLFMNTSGVPSVIQVLQVRPFTNHYTPTLYNMSL